MHEESKLITARRWTHAHPGILLIGTFAVSALIMWLIPVSGTATSLGQSAALAALAVAALLSYRPDMLRWGMNGTSILEFGWYPLLIAILFGGAVAWGLNADGTLGLNTTSPAGAPDIAAAPPQNPTDVFLALVPICLLTGLFEEVLFRGLLFDMATDRFAERPHGVLLAALISALVFGILHVVGDTPSFPLAALRFIQTAAFGFFMCAVYHRTGSIWPVTLIHGLYDVFALWPSALVLGYPMASLLPTGAVGLAASGVLTLMLVPLAFVSVRMLGRAR